ncbi:hypothetical protein OF83DRAFT_1080149 [Amylostereum chailletii]|nr:hypothetical protein OF83DRAFT_1080149 [Amylostereum chailletii]
MSSPITLYDIPGNAWPKKAWSPNCWKVRYFLNMKDIPHKTIWVEYPDIEPEMKKIGAKPTGIRDGMSVLGSWYDLNGEGSIFAMGDKPSFADLEIAGNLLWVRTVCGKDSDVWQTLEKADGGRWVRLLEALAKWETVM